MNRLEITIEYRGTVFDVRHLAEGERFAVGGAADADFPLEAAVFGDRWALAEVREGVPRLRLPGCLPAATLAEGVPTDLDAVDGTRGLTLTAGSRARLEAGEVTFYFATVAAAPRVARIGLRSMLAGDWRSLATAAALHAMVLVVAWAVPVDASSLSLDTWGNRPVWIEAAIRPKAPPKPEALFDALPEPGMVVPSPGAGVAEGPVPPRARPLPSAQTPASRKKAAKVAAAAVAKGIDDALGDALETPLLGAMAAGAMNAMVGTPDGKTMGMYGGPMGVEGGSPIGVPGGTPGASVGISGLDRRGFKHVRDGVPAGIRGDRRPRQPKVPPMIAIASDPEFVGSLEKSEIRRVVRRHRAEYRYCYEKALNAKRDLNGKIIVKFIIGPTGAVSVASVLESTMGDAEVGRCVARRIKRWAFPAPRDNGVVVVRYPFLFKPTGG